MTRRRLPCRRRQSLWLAALAAVGLWRCGAAGAERKAPAEPPAVDSPPAAACDYAKLRLKGDGHRQDSFSLAVQAAAELLARPADYETICALSTNAFSPRVNRGEDCMAWWHVDCTCGGDVGMATVAGRLGLKARLLETPAFKGDWQKPADRAAHLRAVAGAMRAAIARGEVIVATGGWKAKQDGRFVPWCWAGIVTEAREDGTILGACLNGRRDNRMAYVPACWCVSAARPTLTARQADLKMLDDAVARIRGSREPFTQKREGPAFGLDAMRLWIRRMQRVPFCVPCHKAAPDRVWTCAHDNGNTMRSLSRVAASYLRKRKPAFAPPARAHLEAAAAHYDRIVKLLEPAVTGKGGEHYRQIIGDLAKQKAHAKVLKQVEAELSAAADEMEKALAAARRPAASARGRFWLAPLRPGRTLSG